MSVHHVILLAVLAVSVAAGAQPSDAPPRSLATDSTPAPSTLEVEYWRSTEKIGTEAAYRAYLAAFPSGFYSGLASAAIAKLPIAAPTVRVGPNQSPAKQDVTDAQGGAAKRVEVDLARISDAAPSGAVTFRIGDQFHGPGPITVGWLGAKKQIVIPAGTWVVLAASDHKSSHTAPIQLTTVVLGRFEGTLLTSQFAVAFDSRPGSRWARWTEAEKCEAADPSVHFQWKSTIGTLSQCLQVKLVAQPRPLGEWTGVYAGVRTNLARLDAHFVEGYGVDTTIHLANSQGGYMKVSRFDFDVVPADVPRPPQAAIVEAIIGPKGKWARAYVGLALDGMGRNLPTADLTPGERLPTPLLQLAE